MPSECPVCAKRRALWRKAGAKYRLKKSGKEPVDKPVKRFNAMEALAEIRARNARRKWRNGKLQDGNTR